EVVYSGGKSLHFHFCFDLRHLKHNLAVGGNSSYRDNWTRDVPDCLLRPAYAASWDGMAATFHEITDLVPDRRLRSWEQLRRCPWALRLVKGGHLGLSCEFFQVPVHGWNGLIQHLRNIYRKKDNPCGVKRKG